MKSILKCLSTLIFVSSFSLNANADIQTIQCDLAEVAVYKEDGSRDKEAPKGNVYFEIDADGNAIGLVNGQVMKGLYGGTEKLSPQSLINVLKTSFGVQVNKGEVVSAMTEIIFDQDGSPIAGLATLKMKSGQYRVANFANNRGLASYNYGLCK